MPLALNVLVAVIFNAKKGKKAQAIGVLAALLHLTPVMHGAATWKGEGQKENDVVGPVLLFAMGRIGELLLESLPELALSLLLAFRGQSSPKIIASLALSVASAAFTMMDVSVGFERKEMVSAPTLVVCDLPRLTPLRRTCRFADPTRTLSAATCPWIPLPPRRSRPASALSSRAP